MLRVKLKAQLGKMCNEVLNPELDRYREGCLAGSVECVILDLKSCEGEPHHGCGDYFKIFKRKNKKKELDKYVFWFKIF